MSRQKRNIKRKVFRDPIYNNIDVNKLINKVMLEGKKSLAEKIVYSAIERAAEKTKKEHIDFFKEMLNNCKPQVEVKPRKIGGATYQVPVEVRSVRQNALAIRWLVQMARSRSEHTMVDRLCNEMLDAYNRAGKTIKKREEVHKTAEANKAFAHFKW